MVDPVLRFDGLTKRFPGVLALSNVSFEIARGECHAVVGENGAGKSTLGKIVAGIYRPTAGRLFFHGREVEFRTPLEAAAAGISIVHQELAFCPNLSVAENLFLGAMPASHGLVRWAELERRAAAMLANVGLNVAPWTPMSALSTAQEQLVQIAVAVGRGARVIIMDEPTSSLSQTETDRLFEIVRRLRHEGVTILYVSHRLEETRRLCDRVTVLRDGQYIQTLETARTTTDEIVRLMIGRPVEEYFPQHVSAAPGEPLLTVEGLSSPPMFHDISFSVRAGEIVGLAGLVGAGRSEVARAIFGIEPPARGTIKLGLPARRASEGVVPARSASEGGGSVGPPWREPTELVCRPVNIRSARDAIRLGVGYVPEDRKRQGLVLSMTCRENLSLSILRSLKRWLLLDHRRDRCLAGEYFERLRVRAPGVDADIAGLSGGNQQKIALAKWLAGRCRVLILDEPTRGVDVGAKAEIHALIDRLATDGHGILLISSELPEILNLSTRIIVLSNGCIAGELPRERASQEALMRLMANVQAA
jgi:ABC-type sugar transport system ATPase subunit